MENQSDYQPLNREVDNMVEKAVREFCEGLPSENRARDTIIVSVSTTQFG